MNSLYVCDYSWGTPDCRLDPDAVLNLIIQITIVCLLNLVPIVVTFKYRKLVNLFFILGSIIGYILSFFVAYIVLWHNAGGFAIFCIFNIALLIPSWIMILIFSYINRQIANNNKKSVTIGFISFSFVLYGVLYCFWSFEITGRITL